MHDCAFGHGIKDSTRSTSNRKDFLTPFSDDQTPNKNPFIVMDLQPSRGLDYTQQKEMLESPKPAGLHFHLLRAQLESTLATALYTPDINLRSPKGFTSIYSERSSEASSPPHCTPRPPTPKPEGLHFQFTRAQLGSKPPPKSKSS